jgi:hypothetical protein
VKVNIPLPNGLSLEITDQASGREDYPTRRLQKGLLLIDRGQELGEEGVGFGVPILKRGVRTIFPGRMKLVCHREGQAWRVSTSFEMNLVERLDGPSGERLKSQALYIAKDHLAALHRRLPPLRSALNATSAALRRTFGWVTTFEEAGDCTTVQVTYAVHSEEGRIGITLEIPDLSEDGVTEVVVMNEQGGRRFDRYRDSDRVTLQGRAIGTWDEVLADRADFVSSSHRVAFSLGQVEGAKLHRGRELIGSRLAWSGFGYAFPPTLRRFRYDLHVTRMP